MNKKTKKSLLFSGQGGLFTKVLVRHGWMYVRI